MAFSRISHKGRGEVRIYESTHDLSTNLAEYIAEISEASVKERGVFCVALSGGSLISMMRTASCVIRLIAGQLTGQDGTFFGLMSVWCRNPIQIVTISWQRTCFFPRFRYTRAIHSINVTVSAEEAANRYEYAIRQLVRKGTVGASRISDCPKFDLILLGMGPDGHVASLFPLHRALNEKNEWVTFLTDSPDPPSQRITFTLPVINSASNIAIVIAGEDKAKPVQMALMGNAINPSLPAQMVSPSSGNLVWFLDRNAASRLKGSRFSK